MIFSIDPGETVGLCWSLDDKTLNYADELSVDEFIDWLAVRAGQWRYMKNDVIVCEDFRLFAHKAQAKRGSTFPEVQVIGAVRLFARIVGVPLVMQSPEILRLTEMHMHWPVHASNSHIPDYLSAELHLLHYLEETGMSTTTLRELNPDIVKP